MLEFNFFHQTDLKSLMEDVAFIFLALCLRGLATQFWVFVTVSTTGLCLFLWEVFLLRGYRLLVLFILSLLFLLIILDKIRNVFFWYAVLLYKEFYHVFSYKSNGICLCLSVCPDGSSLPLFFKL